MAKCRHPYSSQVKALPPCWVCLRCNARGVSSLGLADDRPSEVQIEIRAAEIVVSKDMMPSTVSSEELRGRMIAHGYNSTFTGDWPLLPATHAGFLSAIIEEDETAALGWDWDPFKPIAGQWPNVPIPESEPPPAFRRNGCPDLDPALPDSAGYPRGPVLCVLYPRCQCGESDQASVIAEQTRHDVAASVARHTEIEQPDAATAWSEYAAGNVKTVEEFEVGRAEIETDSVGNLLPNVAEWFAKHHGDDPTTVDSDDDVCPRCDSPKPHLHPAVQHGGEVQVCSDAFHCRVTPENTPDRIRANGLKPEADVAQREPLVDGHSICPGCDQEIDTDTCHCGEAVDSHNYSSGHGPVPMGCICHQRPQDEPPEETARAHGRIEAGIAKLEPGEGDPDWQDKVWAEIGGES